MATKIQRAKPNGRPAKSPAVRKQRLGIYLAPAERALFESEKGREDIGPFIIRLALERLQGEEG